MSSPYYDGTGSQGLSRNSGNSPIKYPAVLPNPHLVPPNQQPIRESFNNHIDGTNHMWQNHDMQPGMGYNFNGHPPALSPVEYQSPKPISGMPTCGFSPHNQSLQSSTSHTKEQNVALQPPSFNQMHNFGLERAPPVMPPIDCQSVAAPPLSQPFPAAVGSPALLPPSLPRSASELPSYQNPQFSVHHPPTAGDVGSQPTFNSGPNSFHPAKGPGYPPQQFNSTITRSMTGLGPNNEYRAVNLMQERRLISEKKHQQKPLKFDDNSYSPGLVPPGRKNCSPEVFRCTLNAIPSTQALLNKVKLPLGLIVHPFRDLSSLPVISAGTIVRCKRCRTYINPFVNFLDERRWRCNLCFVVNDVPDEFLHHPVTKSYGEPHTRPECTNATLEFIAPQEYMVRPPQPAVYMFLFDVSHAAVETGYLRVVCDALLEHIDHLPGDSRTKIAFLTYNGTLHYYRLAEGISQPQMLIVSDLHDIFLPTPDSLLVNLRERKELICDLLRQLRDLHKENTFGGELEAQSALGAALQAAHKLMVSFGGRITVFQHEIPTTGPGALKTRQTEASGSRDTATELLNPSTDFYKKLALDSSAHQVAIDFFFINSRFIDIASLSCASRFSAGDLHYYPGFHVVHNPVQVERLSHDLDRYLSRKIGFEAVMRIRCTKGLAIHTFHGNFFVRSTDLLSLANINPDAGFGLNLSIEDALTDLTSVCIQAALLYTSSKGERRIRVHTMCFPVAKNINEVFNAVDSHAVVSLLSKMAVDRSIKASLSDARDALVNAVIDAVKSYKEIVNPNSNDNSLLVPPSMKTFPLLISCLLKHPAFKASAHLRHDDRVFAMIDLKMQPTVYALQSIHPDLYRVDDLTDEGALDVEERVIPQPALLPLSAEYINSNGVYLLDIGWHIFVHIGPHASQDFLHNVIGVKQFSDIEQPMYSVPELDNEKSESFHNFVEWLQDQRPHHAPLRVIRSDSREHSDFMMYMRKDKTESSMSYQEFLLHIQQRSLK